MSDLPPDPSAMRPEAGAAGTSPSVPALRGLVLDWGGVLTGSLDVAMNDWAHRDGIDFAAFRDVLRQWGGRPKPGDVAAGGPGPQSGPQPGRGGGSEPLPGVSVAELEQAPDAGPAGISPVHRLERGEISVPDFEKELAAELAVRGAHVPPEGLLGRLLSGLAELDERMLDLLHRARAAGLRTALLSNSWGDHYPERLWQGWFDAVVISGRVGMRKPEPEIFRHTCDRIGLAPQACVMVDDLQHNVAAAVAVGMVGVLHSSYQETVTELEALFDLPLR